MLVLQGKAGAEDDEPEDEDDKEDEEYQEPPQATTGSKRAREEGVRDTGDEKDGYVTDINEDTSEKEAKKPKV